MASKRVENKKIQINTCVEDPFKSIDTLIRVGVEQRARESAGGGHYQRNGKLPLSISKKPTKSRGSSVGHSPQGSSDDGFGSSGRATLSPSSISANTVNGFHPYNPPPNSTVSHFRQGSAPALSSYSAMEHQQASSSRMVPGLPVAHGYSRSLNTVAATSPEMNNGSLSNSGSTYNITPSMQSPELAAPIITQQPCHSTSRSLDLQSVNNHNNIALKQDPSNFDMMNGGHGYHPAPTTTNNSQMQHGYYPNDSAKMSQAGYWHAKSRSLDPMTIAQMPTTMSGGNCSPQLGMTSPHAGSVSAGCSSSNDDPNDGLGPLPEGWSKSYDATINRAYFINHIHKTTTWNDPRIAKEMQENMIDRATQQQHQQQYYLPHEDQQQQNYHHQQQPDYSSVDRLRMERVNMLERQQQLFRDGLLPPQQDAALYGNQQQQQQQQHHQNSYQSGYEINNMQPHQMSGRQYHLPSDAMEVDYSNHIQHNSQQQQHMVDPAFVQDLNPADLNPHEFDKYLYIDRKPQQHVQAARFN